MGHSDCTATLELFSPTKEIKKRWRIRIGFLLKMSPAQFKSKGVTKSRSHRPTVDDVNQWAQSLDKLLSHKYGKAVFFIFLKSEFCEENIEFWTACEDFQASQSQTEMVLKARQIFEEFIRNDAPKEINLDYHTKNTILQSLDQPSGNNFQTAQKKVYMLMENNSYPRFLQSDLYRDLQQEAKRLRIRF